MRILLVYPEYPDTYWSFRHALKFIAKKSSNPPLGLITVAALLPSEWEKKLVDMNVTKLKDKDLKWADYVFISAMSVQKESVTNVLKRCLQMGKHVVAGGPLFTEEYDEYKSVDYLVLNEAEITLPEFLQDLSAGEPKHIYRSEGFADISASPLPDYSLLDLREYSSTAIQYSRGCPFDCEFCDITALFGHRVRTKTPAQIIAELDQLLQIGWRDGVFFVDDNFIGHKKKLKSELLPAIIGWMESHEYPFQFITEASINIADDEELMQMMVKAGFDKVFIGIETPEESCLEECNKLHNRNRNLIESIRTIQDYGMEVCGGFIVGFDNDPPDIFQKQIEFIQNSAIITAMVGLLNAPKLSKLYSRLKSEGRIVNQFTGDNTDYSINFIPAMEKSELIKGYRYVVKSIYSYKPYYNRVLNFLKYYHPPHLQSVSPGRIMALLKSIVLIGLFNRGLVYFWKLVFWCIVHKPEMFSLAITYSIYGYHFRRVFRKGSLA
jgi:radical SAM superfamily enzyme YgiQ (UPF0313 family)